MTAVLSELKVSRTETGYCIRIEGMGTLRQSTAVLTFAGEATEREPISVVLDLTGCEYLDSTFLGCIVMLHRRFGGERFAIVGSDEVKQRLFGPTRLDKLVSATETAPEIVGPWMQLPAFQVSAVDLSRHIMECHRRLAEVEGPNQESFRRIADQIATDLGRCGRLR